MSRPIITLLTDFGSLDPYVGIMKGQILRRCPDAQLVDLTHEIPPQDVRTAAFHLEQSVDYFPPQTVHLAVVDPGVGTSRRMLAVRTERAILVAPDNGLLTRALKRLGGALEAVELPPRKSSSSTFHGRDIMAPAAAELSKGLSLWELGPNLETPMIELDSPPAKLGEKTVQATVLNIDRFGNVTFDLPRTDGSAILMDGSRWSFQGRELHVGRTYGEVEEAGSLLLWSSHDMLELASRNSRADQAWRLKLGQRVELVAAAGSEGKVG